MFVQRVSCIRSIHPSNVSMVGAAMDKNLCTAYIHLVQLLTLFVVTDVKSNQEHEATNPSVLQRHEVWKNTLLKSDRCSASCSSSNLARKKRTYNAESSNAACIACISAYAVARSFKAESLQRVTLLLNVLVQLVLVCRTYRLVESCMHF
jgi:hypothetical protein